MRERSTSNLPVLIGLAVSLALHALAVIPCFFLAMSELGDDPSLLLDQLDAAILEPPDSLPIRVELGIDSGSPSTLNWIGYETYEKHLAMLAITEQPELSLEPPGDSIEEAITAALPPPTPAADEWIEPELPSPVPTEMVTSTVPMPAETLPTIPESAIASEPSPAETPVDEPPAEPRRSVNPLLLNHLLEELGMVSAAEEVPVESPADSVETLPATEDQVAEETEKAKETKAPAEPVAVTEPPRSADQPAPPPLTAPVEPAPASTAAGTPGSSARQADKESDATSIVEVLPEFWQNGKPLSAKGLELKPRRPVFPLLTQMTATPGNPLCVMRFRRDGKPTTAAILHSSGDSRVDRAIESSLYGWRATGKALAQLEGKQTIDIIIRIILIEPRK